MSYRGLKRALGETNIERKCRVAFGFCLAILIFFAFYGVDIICHDLIADTTRRAGRDAVDMAVVNIHWQMWQTKSTGRPELDREFRELADWFSKDLSMNRYASSLLTYGENSSIDAWRMGKVPPVQAADEAERAIMHDLHEQWKQQLSAHPQLGPEDSPQSESPSGAIKATDSAMPPKEAPIPFKSVPDPRSDRFIYYQVVNWTKSCRHCHDPLYNLALPPSELETFKAAQPPFNVVKVVMPYEETRRAETKARAILCAAGILTVFVAMVGLYLIVKYVIVKPLKHLRDVSDEISRGDLSQRAAVHTNDEFEELADAFNRMLSHVADAQEQLKTINARLDTKVDELAQVNMQLYEMNRLKSDFLANMSHELRTPLNSIIGFSDVLRGIESLTDKQRRYAENIQKSGRYLLDMINDILDLAKLEAGRMEIRPTEFRLDQVINAQCDMMRSLSEDKNIDLEVLTDSDALLIYQDQSKVQQILTNLLSNAIKFTPEGGRVTVRAVHTPSDQLELTVADTGVGIPEEDRTIIFEKFRQSNTVLGRDGLTREYSGTGLGLSIVKELCKSLGGEITFVSELGKGSTFTVTLPWSLANRTRSSLDVPVGMSRSDLVGAFPIESNVQRGGAVT